MAITEIEGYEPEITYKKQGQVYLATHKGENYLPFMNRSFISFSYGNKNIEDFNLIATIDGNRMKRPGSATFEDIVTTYDILDGQFYWGTYYKENSLSLTLSTDGITQEQLDDFLNWFQGGKIRELILAEHPNRAIMARVAEPPEISLLPFEYPTTVMIAGKPYATSSTLYKGDISLQFVMDEPYWYSKVNIFGFKDENDVYHDEWSDANGNLINVLDPKFNKDVMKIVLEDGIPISSMLSSSMILGDNIYANLNDSEGAKIARDTLFVVFTRDAGMITVYIGAEEFFTRELITFVIDEQLPIDTISQYLININRATTSIGAQYNIYILPEGVEEMSWQTLNNTIHNALNSISQESYRYKDEDKTEDSIIAEVDEYGHYISGAIIGGPDMASSTGINNLVPGEYSYFYYCGTAPSPVELTFTLTPKMRGNYISIPQNSYAQETTVNPYNIITIESVHKTELQFTTPGIYTSYNKVIYMFKNLEAASDWAAVRDAIRKDVHHSAVRAWANKVIDYLDKNATGIISATDSANAQNFMSFMFKPLNIVEQDIYLPGTYTFNSKTGKATAQIQYRATEITLPLDINEWVNYGTLVNYNSNIKEEDVGDMLKSNYLFIRDRNYPDKVNGSINQWTEGRKDASHRIYHDVDGGLKHIMIKYKNLYL